MLAASERERGRVDRDVAEETERFAERLERDAK